MTSLYEFLSSSIATDLAQSLLHSLWQALIIALLLLFALKGISGSHSRLRYRLALLSIVAVVLSWIGTYSILRHEASPNMVPTRQQNRTVQSSIQTETAKQISNPARQTPASTAVQTIPIPPSPKPKPNGLGYGWLISAWFIGVVLMTVRIFIAMAGASRHKRKATPIKDPALVTLLKNLCTRMDVKRKIRFAATHTLNHPSVIGFWKPMLLIPASMLTGTPLSDLEAIIAHELAHVHRHDYLINLGQMILESIFFFNPAVWWISRQIRTERETCCDLLGIHAIGRRADYAKVLVDEFARTSSLPLSEQPAVAMGFGNDNQTSTDRIRRIIHPRQKPTMKIGSVRLALLIGIATLALVALSKTADLTVEAAAKILTPKERVKTLQQLADDQREVEKKAKEFARLQSVELAKKQIAEQERNKVFISGTVRTSDGKPLPKKLQGHRCSHNNDDCSSHGGFKIKNGSFSFELFNDGSLQIAAIADGYAPIFSKVYRSATGERIENVALILRPGFTAILEVYDETGQPIPDVTVHNAHIFKTCFQGGTRVNEPTEGLTGQNGQILFEHTGEGLVGIDLFKEGYQFIDGHECSFEKDIPLRIQMKKGLTASGTILNDTTGKPVPQAEVRLLHRSFNRRGKNYPAPGRLLTKADKNGFFTISTLRRNETYDCTFDAPSLNRVMVDNIKAEMNHLTVRLEPEKVIHGRIANIKHWLNERYINGKHIPIIEYCCERVSQFEPEPIYEDFVPLSITNGVGYFEIRDIVGDQFRLGNRHSHSVLKAEIEITDQTDYTIALDMNSRGLVRDQQQSRKIEIHFLQPDGFPPSNGEITFYYQTKKMYEKDPKKTRWNGTIAFVTNGICQLNIAAPVRIRLANTSSLAGYLVQFDVSKSQQGNFIPPDTDPFIQTYNLLPAGGVHGKILDSKSNPINKTNIRIYFPRTHLKGRMHGKDAKKMMARHKIVQAMEQTLTPRYGTKFHGEYALSSMPLNYPFIIAASSNHTFIVSDRITLTEENPIQEIPLQLADSKTIEGFIRHPDGSPMQAVKVALHIRFYISKNHNPSIETLPIETDENGYFYFDHVNPDKQLSYTLKIHSQKGYQGFSEPVKLGSNKIYTLEPEESD